MAMGEFIGKLCGLFGASGVGSIMAWTGALVLLAAGARSARRAGIYKWALAVAFLAFVLSRVNSTKVDTYREDPKEAQARLDEERKKKLAEGPSGTTKTREGAAPVRFAEDDRDDRDDLAGVAKNGKSGKSGKDDDEYVVGEEAPEGAAEEKKAEGQAPSKARPALTGVGDEDAAAPEGDEDYVPLYKRRGKREREGGKKRSEGAVAEGDAGGEGGAYGDEAVKVAPGADLLAPLKGGPAGPEVVYLPERDVYLANRLDMVNLRLAWATLLLAIGLVVFDYLRRFNATNGRALPLPIAALPRPFPGLVDYLSPKASSVLLAGAEEEGGSGAAWSACHLAVRRGETFIYLGERDPWEAEAVPRLPFGLWPLGKLTFADSPDSEFILESAWFGRYCFVVEGDPPRGGDPAQGGDDAAKALLDALVRFLSLRQSTRARALRTVNVAWDHDAPPSRDVIDELAFLCRETNFRLIVASRGEPPSALAPLFDEVVLLDGAVVPRSEEAPDEAARDKAACGAPVATREAGPAG